MTDSIQRTQMERLPLRVPELLIQGRTLAGQWWIQCSGKTFPWRHHLSPKLVYTQWVVRNTNQWVSIWQIQIPNKAMATKESGTWAIINTCNKLTPYKKSFASARKSIMKTEKPANSWCRSIWDKWEKRWTERWCLRAKNCSNSMISWQISAN